MANDASKIRFAPNGSIYLAPAPSADGSGTTLPTEVDATPTGFTALGYVDEAGVTITPTIETTPVNAWQSATPVLYNVTSSAFQVSATLMETSKLTTELFYGAPWVEQVDEMDQPTGVFRLDLASTPELDEWAIVVDWSQKSYLYRVVIGRAMISDRGAITLQRTENQRYELTIDALDKDGSLGYVLSNDPAFGAA